ncbi:conserved hypothetical protein [Methanococcus vannielii SB]|uniref:Uncharacterized protein n=1 Tax=Methanococcus vannielii (strain ATCC 35089 / DSM 1224 / JCM 13029 / OCM 148 / SB) TaxID=406327 RepID=A6UQU2_METVS|nr:hypothetical protein [Methanococcus vannielii]ABR54864.1 conserved hypothetical protein [Methanococcus vannielii SB]
MINNELILETAPYVQDLEYIKELIENSKDITDLVILLNKLIADEKEISKKTDLKILMEKIEELKLI